MLNFFEDTQGSQVGASLLVHIIGAGGVCAILALAFVIVARFCMAHPEVWKMGNL